MDCLKSRRYLLTVVILGLMVVASPVLQAAEAPSKVELLLKPTQCVALHEGQDCYANVELLWEAVNVGNYCLYSTQQNRSLQCWQNGTRGNYKSAVLSNQDILFTIRLQESDVVLAQQELVMAWVYRRSNRSRITWRLF